MGEKLLYTNFMVLPYITGYKLELCLKGFTYRYFISS
jgi:hypothetical protein